MLEGTQQKPTETLSFSDFLFPSHLCPPLMIAQLFQCSVMVLYHFFLYHVNSRALVTCHRAPNVSPLKVTLCTRQWGLMDVLPWNKIYPRPDCKYGTVWSCLKIMIIIICVGNFPHHMILFLTITNILNLSLGFYFMMSTVLNHKSEEVPKTYTAQDPNIPIWCDT